MNESELNGAEAVEYAQQRLKKVRGDAEGWEIEYVDEKTGEKWLMDYPHAELQGGGSPRLRRVS
jgi:hypothetical protein